MPPSVPFSPFTSGKLYEVDLAERLIPAQDHKVNTMTEQVFEPKHNTLASAPHLMLVAFGPHNGGTFLKKRALLPENKCGTALGCFLVISQLSVN